MQASREIALYPICDPIEAFGLDVGDGHVLHVEIAGNPDGRPAVVLHGGPGAGCSPDHRRFFDPAAYRIVLFDQRGAGRSTPLGSVERNTTPDLIADLERLRCHLGIDRWLLFGGSWGSTLALAYAAEHPAHVAAMVLRGIWLGRSSDIAWHMAGLRSVAPDHWQAFAAPVESDDPEVMLETYWRRLSAPDPSEQLAAAGAWCAYEQHFTTLLPAPIAASRSREAMLALARIEVHYYRNRCFLRDDQLIAGVAKLDATPVTLIHGRYDLLARLEGAWVLAKAWPSARLEIIPNAAHSAFEPGIRSRLIAATDRYARLDPWK